MKPPKLSVVMPAYNAQAHLAEAVGSVLSQSFADFELIALNDGSKDDTPQILEGFSGDPRLRVLHNEQNKGLIDTLHMGLAACRAPLIARMDSDDICDPQRFERQVAFLQAHPEVDIVGGAIRFFGNIPGPYVFRFPESHEAIRPAMLFYCPLAHPTLMFRRSLVDRGLLGYDDAFRHAEDYHLWSRLLLQVRSANLPEMVLHYRLHKTQVSSGQANHQYDASLRVRQMMLEEAGVAGTPEEVALHESVILERPLERPDYLEALAAWFGRVEEANRNSGYWDAACLNSLFRHKFTETVKRLGVESELGRRDLISGYFDGNLPSPPLPSGLRARGRRLLGRFQSRLKRYTLR